MKFTVLNKIIYLKDMGIEPIRHKIVIRNGKKLVIYIFKKDDELDRGLYEYRNSKFAYLCNSVMGIIKEMEEILLEDESCR